MEYLEILKLTEKLWIWLFKNPGKIKNESPYWDEIKNYIGSCPLCHFYGMNCDNCIFLYKNKPCVFDTKSPYKRWSDSVYSNKDFWYRKPAAAKIASLVRRERKRVENNK